MTNTAILAASGLLLLAYALEHLGRRFRLPSVVLMIVVGLVARQVLDALGLHYHWVDPIVPVIGTLGLILIVLEGALDLTVTRERGGLIVTAAAASLAGFLATLGAFTAIFRFLLYFDLDVAILAAIPFAVISSAVAIPAAAGLADKPREFIVYESSLSDILGVLVFYAWVSGEGSFGEFTSDLLGGGAFSLIAALAAGLALFYFINQIVGHVRFLPLLAGLVFLYAIGKALHMSPLIVVLVCGLIINNPHLVTWHEKLRGIKNDTYEQTLHEFKGLVAELTFAMKSFFFLLLGYWTDVRTMLSVKAWLVAIAGIAFILASRWVILVVLRQRGLRQLIWIAPRGLITVLLFLSARDSGKLDNFPFGAVMLVVLVTAALTALAHSGAAHAQAAPAAQPEAAPPPTETSATST
ncbi:MAG TPA: sodium:proton antiporter [Casimicrobiaceae bacterium]|nr:sodium:proton antiporter [Casimicrobiaceae bacterium]